MSAESPTSLFDHAALTRQRRLAARRAAASGPDRPTPFFLIEEVRDRLHDRLKDINRSFQHWLDIGGLSLPGDGAAQASLTVAGPDPRASLPEHAACHPMTGEILPVAEKSFDLVTSTLGLHWVNDLPGLMIQARRALRPDGLFMVSLFGGDTLHELRHALLAAESEVTGGANARIAPFGDVRDLGHLLQRAGFALPVSDTDRFTVTYTDALSLMRDLKAMGEGNALAGRRPLRRDVLMRAAARYQETHAQPDGRIPATFEVITLTGWHPHESQQKPLRPGSGTASLKDVL
ncbi:methyltransferase domain-containing protein [Yunchengibacter salinarum]|uniref:methyltransferase domain-containing protein n=1 Tax=Yunchengibacter salinarum TaxID=3133399 RepID=UPI0035B65D6E